MTLPAEISPPRFTLPDRVRRFLLDGLRFATIASVSADGSPHQAVVWFDVLSSPEAGDRILLNSAEGRRWPANLRREGRLSLTVEGGYEWVSISGPVEIVDEQPRAQADIAALSRRYHAGEPEVVEQEIRRFRTQQRVTFLLQPAAVHAELEED